MKKVLITGANSYIGMSFEKWIKDNCNDITVETVDMIGDEWKKVDFGNYDAVFHVAGIAHQKETKKNAGLYYRVNRDLAIDTANKAKADGCKQFVLLSSMSVYGINCGKIDKTTKENPKTHYGISKFEADQTIIQLSSEKFVVSILRPPMVYGKGCKGNYQLLRKLAIKCPFFPRFNNERSMIYIGNLVAFVEMVIRKEIGGLFFPQNEEYVNTSYMVQKISESHCKKKVMTVMFNVAIKGMLMLRIGLFEKVFGSLVYEKIDLCNTVEFTKSIIETEK